MTREEEETTEEVRHECTHMVARNRIEGMIEGMMQFTYSVAWRHNNTNTETQARYNNKQISRRKRIKRQGHTCSNSNSIGRHIGLHSGKGRSSKLNENNSGEKAEEIER